MTNSLWSTLENFIDQYGLLGVFIVSFLGNTIPYSTVPYLLFIILYAGVVEDPILHLLITFAGGFGAALGKLVVYFFGYGVRKVLPESVKANMEVFTQLFKRSAFIAVLIFAASPLPDDIIYVPLGATKYDIRKYFIALVIGKTIITGISVYFGSTFTSILKTTTKYPDYVVVPILLIVTIYLVYLVAKINWVEVANIASKKGFIAMIKYLLLEVFRSTFTIFRTIIRRGR